jgi:hypothetical protein
MRFGPARLAVIVAGVLALPQPGAALPNSPVKTQLTVPFSGVVYHPATAEHVAISGSLAVKTVVRYSVPGNPVTPNNPIFASNPIKVVTGYKLVTGTTATGQTTGASYELKGSGVTQYVTPANPAYPSKPIRTVSQYAVFRMTPGNPIVPGNPMTGFRVLYR